MYTIVLFPKIQVDTAIAYFLLTTFGEQAFPGIGKANLEFWTELPDVSVDELEQKGYILIDLGNSQFDHHRFGPDNKKITTSLLIAEHLGIADKPDLQKLLELARRDDLEGKGTISSDPIDRAFGISALLTNLNKTIPDNPKAILSVITPLITAHYMEENRRHEHLPREYGELLNTGKLTAFTANQLGRNLKLVLVESDNPALAGYLRSKSVGADLVIQRSTSGHVNFITNQRANVKLNKLAKVIKLAEAEKNKLVLPIDDLSDLEKPGRTNGLAHWYYDTRANTLQNGGINPQSIPPTLLDDNEIIDLAKEGLNIERVKKEYNKHPRKISKGRGVVYLD